ncbi:hypothetical protein LTR62_007975 [Meristemomyces frigidus]|uniref:Uncharacterized protein n=1 Tax=Meristemomyces frigidus TaxID=1508187 RepID=A0AAN7YMB4_9PEZI|nr:hypothetical protein LTR62_007975 [Meristemomyces frigidus]
MGSLLVYLNRLLPFATPGTPVVQDIIHLAAICGVLYFAPQVQEWYRRSQAARQAQPDSVPQPDHDDAHNEVLPLATGERQQDHAAPQEDEETDGEENDAGPEDHIDDDGAAARNDFPPPVAGQAQPGPAREFDSSVQRNVGAKKAKALARRDQKRAYHEFQRAQGDAQRAKDAEGAAEREAILAREQERRREATAAVEAKKTKERELQREQESRAREAEIERRESAVRIVREELEGKGMSDLDRVARRVGSDVDCEWVERIVKAAGLIGRKADIMTMVTSTGWAVRVSAEDMQRLYESALQETGKGDGVIRYEAMGGLLEKQLRGRAAPVP